MNRSTTSPRLARPGMTLVELLVVMALIASLAAMVMVVAPGALQKDRAAAAVTQLQGALQIARARAMRDGLPRGIRIVMPSVPDDPATTIREDLLATEYREVEVQPAFIPNAGGPLALTPYSNPGQPAPYVQFVYTLQPQPQPPPAQPPPPGAPAPGTIISRECRVFDLHSDHVTRLKAYPGETHLLHLPTLGTWHRFNTVTQFPPPPASPQYYILTDVPPAVVAPAVPRREEFNYPDAQLGVQTKWRTYHFGIYDPPQALIGESTLALPRDTCVDLNPSPLPAMIKL